MDLTAPTRIELTISWGDTVLECLSDEGAGPGGVSEALDRLLESEWVRSLPASPAFDAERIEAGEVLTLHQRDLVFRMQAVDAVALAIPPISERLNYAWLNSLTLALFAHVLLIPVLLMDHRPTELGYGALARTPFYPTEFRFTEHERAPLRSGSDQRRDGSTQKTKGLEGESGRPKAQGRGRAAGKDRNDDRHVVEHALRGLLGVETPDARSVVMGSGVLGTELENALGGVTGRKVGDAGGALGLGTRGEAPGTGGLQMQAVGLGALGGPGRGPGADGYRSGLGRPNAKSDRDIIVNPGDPVIVGALDKELIRQVIEENRAQIRYCYEKELVRTPGLFGKLGVVWTISASGLVEAVRIKEDTLGNGEVARCVAVKIRSWAFPKPRGGGVVMVNYPFVFKSAG
jgi:hypothetical protein